LEIREKQNTMTENNTDKDINKYLFINLVTMLSITAMQQLGKLVNPAAGKADLNLAAAQTTIDTLDMLSAKTGGNLDKDEARLLKDTIASLKMNYVETRDEEERKANKDAPKTEPPSQSESAPKPGSDQTKDPKFHKSYE